MTTRARGLASILAGLAIATPLMAQSRNASRDVYQLAMQRRDHPAEAIALFRRYVALEPRDAWGYLALGEAYARAGKHDASMAALDTAARLAPDAGDIAVARGKELARAGRVDEADAALGTWTAAHADDVDAWRELGRVRRRAGRERGAVDAFVTAQHLAHDGTTAQQLAAARTTAAPRFGAVVRGARDSDGNATRGATLSLDALVGDRVRLGVAATTRGTSYLANDATVQEGQVRLAWRPAATFAISGDVGAVRLGAGPSASDTIVVTTTTTTPGTTGNGKGNGKGRGSGGTSTTVATPVIVVHPGAAAEAVVVAHGRARWRAGGGNTIVDVRGGLAPLEATPALLANRVVRADAGITLERALAGRLRVRAIAQGARYDERTAPDSLDGTNTRTTLGGGPVVDVAEGVQLGISALRSSWSHATTAGYFAPSTADLAEAGLYLERELGARGATLSIDAGAGMQRLQPFGDVMGAWGPAGRLWAQLAVPVGRATLASEIDMYRSQLGGEAATTASWSSAGASVSLRVPLR